jgi:hypothetical protein
VKRRPQRGRARLELTVLPPLAMPLTTPQANVDRLQILARLDGAQVVGELRISGGRAGEAWHQIIAAHESLRSHLQGGAHAQPTRKAIESLGRKLFSLLFPAPVRALYEEARRARRVELVFTSLVPWIADKPWELMCDPRRGFVARGKVRFSRSAPSDVPARVPPPRRGAMRVLIAVVQPREHARLSWEEETQAIARGFQPLEEQGLLNATLVHTASLKELRRALESEPFDVLHFVGHGGWEESRDRGYLLFEDKNGADVQVSPNEMVRLLRDRGLRLLFLNACETGRGSRRGRFVEFNRGIAPALLASGLPAVVANQYPVFDRPAAAFAQRFYAALGKGKALGEAAHEARSAIGRGKDRDEIEWAVPVLYARDPSQRLCSQRPKKRSTKRSKKTEIEPAKSSR